MSSVFHPFPQHRKSVQGVNFQELLYADDTHLSLPVAPGLSTTVYIWMISVLVYIIHLFQFPERQHTFQEWKQNADFIRCQIFGRRACKPNSTDSSWIVTKKLKLLVCNSLITSCGLGALEPTWMSRILEQYYEHLPSLYGMQAIAQLQCLVYVILRYNYIPSTLWWQM